MRIKLDFSIERDENDINLSSNEVCELIENILSIGTKETNTYINGIYHIERRDDIE